MIVAESINIFTTADFKYRKHLTVTIASILLNANDEDRIKFYIFDFGIGDLTKQYINQLKNIKQFDVEYIILNQEMKDFLQKFKTLSHLPERISFNTYARLLIFNFYSHIGKCIWLDTDIIVLQSLSNLINYDMQGSPIGAVSELISSVNDFKNNRLYLSEHAFYFNAGVLLIDTTQYEGGDIYKIFEEKLKERVNNNQYYFLEYADQDCLNLIFEGEVYKLPVKYNISRYVFKEGANYSTENYLEDEISLARNNSFNEGIIHFLTGIKPWSSFKKWFRSPHYYLYWYYLKFTPYNRDSLKYIIFSAIATVVVKIKRKNLK